MTTVTYAAEHLSRLIEQGFGHYSLKLCTRGLESLRPDGRELDLCKPDSYAETAHDGRKVAYLRARDGDWCSAQNPYPDDITPPPYGDKT